MLSMDRTSAKSEARFDAYLEELIQVFGHADRAEPMRDYCTGLLLPIERKSVEPMAAATEPGRVSAKHQSLLHFVGKAPWSDEAVLAKVLELALPAIKRSGPIRAWIIDDTGVPKKGRHSVGVARQYCGQLGKQDNCQVAVTLSIANDAASLPIAHRLYLPEAWANDAERRAKAGVPDDIEFKTKPEIALDQIKAAHAAGTPTGVVLADAGYGFATYLRNEVSALGLSYVMGVQGSQIRLWRAEEEALAPQPKTSKAKASKTKATAKKPISAKDLAMSLPARAWRRVTWREGTNAPLKSRFAAVRVRSAHQHSRIKGEPPVEWLLIEWPKGEKEPTKYWLSTLPETIALRALVDIAKLRWRIERDYQELKQEIGLGHYEGRSWRGFHHHATLCIASYGFLISEREAIPPSGSRIARRRKVLGLPKDYRPRGSPDPNRATHPKLHRNRATTPLNRPRTTAAALPVLRQNENLAEQAV